MEDLFVNREALIFRHGRVRPESFGRELDRHRYRRPVQFAAFLVKNYWLRRGAMRVPGGLWIIDNLSPGSYFHWMTECLPRLLQAERSFPDEQVLLLPAYYREPYIHFTIQAFPKVERIGWIGGRAKIRVARLAWVPRQAEAGTYLPGLMRELGARIRALVKPGGPERVYLARDSGRRRIKNEHDVARLLRRHDFERVVIDANDPGGQVRMAAAAKCIVGLHGAALVNLMFMRGGDVLELRHGGPQFFDCYRPLAEAVGVRYHALTCELASDVAGYDANHTDVIVDLDRLSEALRHG